MSFSEQHLKVQRTARYYQSADISAQTQQLWFVCHGYGQLGAYFAPKFASIADASTVIIAPEALSRFYQSAFNGRVGATWMTKEDRLHEIEDYIAYLNQLYNHILAQHPQPQTLQIHILGFSQGVATAVRWAANGHVQFHHLTAWAGTFPTELDYEVLGHNWKTQAIDIVYGLQDEFFTEANFQTHINQLAEAGLQFDTHTFEGKHDLHHDTLMHIAQLRR
ncbi:alpha/beta hydrolase [Eisenibacter elegans]|jgi:predicted esterase|uniref:alpha/beta hydrolase n=1 Tax=Eisenibacter elegans TaxID=997 RepID=UPI000415DA42|nr:dienelactone hydrolase family protein [Eisenibacter elegans]